MAVFCVFIVDGKRAEFAFFITKKALDYSRAMMHVYLAESDWILRPFEGSE